MLLIEQRLYRFGNFTLDVKEKVLLRNDRPVLITPKTFELLYVLVKNYGHIVEKDTLLNEVWPDSFVEDSNLTFTIRQLRKALEDDARNPIFLETVPRRGYRFIAEIEEIRPAEKIIEVTPVPEVLVGKADPGVVSNQVPSVFGFAGKYGSLIFLAIFLLTASFITISIFFYIRNRNNPNISAPILSAPQKFEVLSNSGNIFQAVISPDGKYVAYVTVNQAKQTIWLRELATHTNLQLLPFSEEEFSGLKFSSKSDSIYFIKKPVGSSQDQTSIYRISTLGGITTKIISNTQGWISVSPDDTKIAFARTHIDDQNRNALMIADIDGKNEKALMIGDAHYYFQSSRWSPDGQAIAFAAGRSDNGASEFTLNEINIETGQKKEITPHKFFHISDLEWLPDQSGLIFTARENLASTNQIWQVSSVDGKAFLILDNPANYSKISLDKDATQILANQGVSDFHLSISGIADQTNLLNIPSSPEGAYFTPGGKIIYSSNLNGQTDIWIMNPDGSEQKQLTNNQFADFCPRPSQDEKYIFFTSNRSGSNQIWRMNFDGGDQVQITQRESGYPIFVTPDGKTLFYQSTKDRKLWKIPTDGGNESLFLETPVTTPAFSTDGRLLAYFYHEKSDRSFKINVISTDSLQQVSAFRQVNEDAAPLQIFWAKDNKSFFYASRNNSNFGLWQQRLDDKAPQKIKDINDEVIDFSFSPDNQKLAVVSGKWRNDAVLIKGFK